MVPGKISEVELLKMLGDYQWMCISSLLEQRSSEIVNALKERLYASFINIELCFHATQPQTSFDEGAQVHVRNGVQVYANKFIEGLSVFSTSEIPPAIAETVASRADLERSGLPWAYITNAFVTRAAGNSRLKVFEPAGMSTRDVPKMTVLPTGMAEHEGVQFTGKIPEFTGVRPVAAVAGRTDEPILYRIVPESDLNGAGLLYFARYVAIMNYAERIFLSERLPRPWSRPLIASLSTERRKIFYFSNADPDDVVQISVTAQVCQNEAGDGDSAPGKRRDRMSFIFRTDLHRASDNVWMASSAAHKSLSLAGHEKGVVAESERFFASLQR